MVIGRYSDEPPCPEVCCCPSVLRRRVSFFFSPRFASAMMRPSPQIIRATAAAMRMGKISPSIVVSKDEGGRMKDEQDAGSSPFSSFRLHPSSLSLNRPPLEQVRGQADTAM